MYTLKILFVGVSSLLSLMLIYCEIGKKKLGWFPLKEVDSNLQNKIVIV